MISRNIAIIRNAAPHDFGGGERFPVLLAKVLQEQNYQPLIISGSENLLSFADSQKIPKLKGWWWKKQDWSGANYLLLPAYIVWQIVLFAFYIAVFTKHKIQIAHIQSKDDFIAATLAAKLLHARVIWTDHADLKHILLHTDIPGRNITGKMVRWAMKYADTVTVVSMSELELVKKHISAKPLLTGKLQTVYNGAFDHIGEYPRAQHKPVRILFAGRIVSDKGINETIEAMKLVHATHPDNELDVIGDGPEYEKYHELASPLSYISFHGHQDNPMKWMSQSDIFVLPTYHEGFSLALVEASMMQLAIVASNVGGNPEIIHDKTGMLIPPKDSKALADAIIRLIDNSQLCEELASNARQQYVDKFQFDRIVKEQFIPLYEKNSH